MEARAISHLEITTYIGCPVRCSYCPQEVLLKNYKGEMVMSLETFKKILKNVPSNVDIHFSGFSEPFCHKEIVKFLKEAFKKHQVVVYTTTIGINDEIIDEIKDMPL